MLPYNKEFKQLIEKSKNILIVTHKSPDVDAFCSMILIKLLIEQIDSQKKVVMKARQMPTARLPRMKEITLIKELKEEEEDLIVVVDAGNLNLCVDFTKDPIKDTNKMIVCIGGSSLAWSSTGAQIQIGSGSGNKFFATLINSASNGGVEVRSSDSLTWPSWCHVAVVASSGTATLFVNGVSQGVQNTG